MPAAARVTDSHTCPSTTGTIPHVGGPITGPGDATVLIESMPASVVGDSATCVGSPDTTAAGSATVLIGGVPAVRLGDSTAHGGVIITGAATVIIGG